MNTLISNKEKQIKYKFYFKQCAYAHMNSLTYYVTVC